MAPERGARLTLPRAVQHALTGPVRKGLGELSRELGVSEKLLPDALEKLSRSLQQTDMRLHTEPPHCIACGFEFEQRTRTKRPSRCARCRSERIAPARFWIE